MRREGGFGGQLERCSAHLQSCSNLCSVLETVAGIPGMVGGMVRHLHSLRTSEEAGGG